MDRSTGGVVELDGVGVGEGRRAPARSVTARRAVGPRPVRPAGPGERAPVLRRGGAVGGAVGAAVGAGVPAPGARLLEPRALPRARTRRATAVSARRYALRRAVAAAALGLLSMLVVVALGLVAEAAGAAHARAGVPVGPVGPAGVVVESGDTGWDLAVRPSG